MKKINILILFAIVLFAGCKKDPEVVSKVVPVTYPTINLIGDEFVWIPIGGSYTDQGATLIDDISGASSSIAATSNDVDNTQPGIYSVVFEAANANGFKTTVERKILVLDYTPAVGLTLDLSGLWLRTNGIPVNYIQMAPGLYILDNFAGSSLVLPAYLITPDNSTIDIPSQRTIGGEIIDCLNETLDTNVPYQITYVVDNPNFGTSTRVFNKQ